DHRYLKTPVIRTGDVVETTMTPAIRAHRPWQVRFLKQDGGLWKVVAIHRETAQN
ncbi:MAG: hypothetical protein H7338_05340, partial [Candidatus Sericytochromatia bacterium]|nr:hypothetical protein [Candidatus Sericytochromatia bacterium]